MNRSLKRTSLEEAAAAEHVVQLGAGADDQGSGCRVEGNGSWAAVVAPVARLDGVLNRLNQRLDVGRNHLIRERIVRIEDAADEVAYGISTDDRDLPGLLGRHHLDRAVTNDVAQT